MDFRLCFFYNFTQVKRKSILDTTIYNISRQLQYQQRTEILSREREIYTTPFLLSSHGVTQKRGEDKKGRTGGQRYINIILNLLSLGFATIHQHFFFAFSNIQKRIVFKNIASMLYQTSRRGFSIFYINQVVGSIMYL